MKTKLKATPWCWVCCNYHRNGAACAPRCSACAQHHVESVTCAFAGADHDRQDRSFDAALARQRERSARERDPEREARTRAMLAESQLVWEWMRQHPGEPRATIEVRAGNDIIFTNRKD